MIEKQKKKELKLPENLPTKPTSRPNSAKTSRKNSTEITSESDTGYQTSESPFGEKEQINQSEKKRGQNLSQSEEAEFRQKFRQIVFNPNPRKPSLFENAQELLLNEQIQIPYDCKIHCIQFVVHMIGASRNSH